MSVVLVEAEENTDHKPVYFTMKMLTDSKSQYSSFEKVAYSLRVAAKKLRPYF